MTRFALALAVSATLFAQAPAVATAPAKAPGAAIPWGTPDQPFTSDAARLLREVAEHQEAVANLEELSDSIGPRLTSSDRLRRAQAWAMARLKGWGAVNVHEEAYAFGPSWTRGEEHARLLNANGQRLLVAQAAWTPGTAGKVEGEVVLLEAASLADFQAAIPALKGRILLLGAWPKPDEAQKKDRLGFRKAIREAMDQGHFPVVLMPSGKKNDLLNMTGSPNPGWSAGNSPRAFLAEEHASLLKRLIRRQQHPRIEVELGGALSAQPVQAYNVVADLPGTDKADELVIVGGHLDSWDLGTGATDNGTGSVACMEVLRALAALKLKPRRTLRVVLFSGEEEGLMGSDAYVKAHPEELAKIQAVFIDDMGTGRITGWPDMGKEAHRAFLAKAMAPVNNLGCVTLGTFTGAADTDHWAFHKAGVPAFPAIQDEVDYMTATHHSQVDTFDHVVPEDLIQTCQVMTAMAWDTLNCPDRLVHGEQ